MRRTPRVTVRKIADVASTKKRDAMASTDPDSLTTPTGGVQMTNAMGAMLYCPTYLYHEEDSQSDHMRNASKIYWKGVSENLLVSNGTNAQIFHRRICFWHHRRFGIGAPLQSDVAEDVWFRPLRFLDLTSPTGEARDLIRLIFAGTMGRDWTHILSAKADRSRIRIVSDRVRNLSAQVAQTTPIDAPDPSLGYVRPWRSTRYRKSHFSRRTIHYDDEEDGVRDGDPPFSDGSGSPWSSDSPSAPGQFYILDIFSVDGSPDPTVELPENSVDYRRPFIFIDSVRYWHEA